MVVPVTVLLVAAVVNIAAVRMGFSDSTVTATEREDKGVQASTRDGLRGGKPPPKRVRARGGSSSGRGPGAPDECRCGVLSPAHSIGGGKLAWPPP